MLAAAGCGSHSTNSSNGAVASSPPSTPVTLSETGSTLLYTLFDTWASVYQTKYPNVSINTAATGSGNGIAQAAAGAVTIGGSDSYLSEADMSAHKSLMNIALAISAQQINYNLPGVKENLKLNGTVLAAMYRGSVTAWNDPQIAALNPGVNLPDTPVVPLHRSDGSGDTFMFTQYLSKQDPEGWGKSPGFGTTVNFPAVPGALAEKGNGGMVTGCAKTPGCVAYVGVSFSNQAEQSGLGEAQLANKSGKYMMLTAKSMKVGAADLSAQTPSNEAISLIDGPAADGYPIVNYEYAIVDSHQKDPSTAQTLQAFLHWAITDGGTPPFLGKVRFQPLPAAVAKLSDAQIAKISS
jgi:phosphate transport system substrate-binding protein